MTVTAAASSVTVAHSDNRGRHAGNSCPTGQQVRSRSGRTRASLTWP